MTKIGIFWVYKNQVIGKAYDLSQGDENIPGPLDSPDSHIDEQYTTNLQDINDIFDD